MADKKLFVALIESGLQRKTQSQKEDNNSIIYVTFRLKKQELCIYAVFDQNNKYIYGLFLCDGFRIVDGLRNQNYNQFITRCETYLKYRELLKNKQWRSINVINKNN